MIPLPRASSSGAPAAPAQGEVVEAAPALFIRNVDGQILAQETNGRSFPLPRELAALLPGWRNGVSITWDREACMLGGLLERKTVGYPLAVAGGFCFDLDTQTWRTARLPFLPPEFQPAYGPAGARDCRTVMIGNERAVSCDHRSGGGLGARCLSPMPVEHRQGTYRLVGLR